MAKPAWPSLSILFLTIAIPIAFSIFILYQQPEGFDPVPIVLYSFDQSIAVPVKKLQILVESERIGDGLLPGPEDLAYDSENGYLYTGCYDGWIRRVWLEEKGKEPSLNPNPKVEDWAYVGGRPLGLALGPDKSIVVADSVKVGLFFD